MRAGSSLTSEGWMIVACQISPLLRPLQLRIDVTIDRSDRKAAIPAEYCPVSVSWAGSRPSPRDSIQIIGAIRTIHYAIPEPDLSSPVVPHRLAGTGVMPKVLQGAYA